jgi:phenylalanyl-tRNA synthetase alpha subunit
MNISFYLNDLKSTIQTQIDLLDCLKKRIEINEAKKSESSLTNEELNEIFISTIKTKFEVETLTNIIKEKESYFEKYAKNFEKELNEANTNWDVVIAKAKQQLPKNPNLKPYLDAIERIGDVNTDLDKKVFIYKRIKPLLNG